MIREKWEALTGLERGFILWAMVCSFLISFNYAIVRPVSNAVFLTAYSSFWFPYAWLAAVPLNLVVVSLYNKYLPRLGCFKMFLSVAGSVTFISLFAALCLKRVSWLPFFFYIWKEVYILLMFQQLWSVIHSTISIVKAKYLYGILFGVGALGSLTGSLVPSFFAVKVGSEALLLTNLPLFVLLCYAYYCLLQYTPQGLDLKIEDPERKSSVSALKHGIYLITKSKFLIFILLIVTFMQISSTLIDFQFNHFLERTIPTQDLRTQYTGRLLAVIHSITFVLQFVGSFLLVHFLGIRKSHVLIPVFLCLNALGFLFFPVFAMISFSYLTIKCFDFSLFGVIKEMLYIPLEKDEKFRAKAIIDVFAYRAAKAFASFLILGLQLLAVNQVQLLLSWTGVCVFAVWCLMAKQMLKDYESVTAS